MSKMGLFHSRLSEKEGARMVLLIIFGVTIGAILGTRFRVFVVVPAIFFAAAIVAAIGYVNGLSGNIVACAISYVGVAGAWISGGLLWGGLSCRPRQTAVRYRACR
jgi:hypothetical protein